MVDVHGWTVEVVAGNRHCSSLEGSVCRVQDADRIVDVGKRVYETLLDRRPLAVVAVLDERILFAIGGPDV